MLQLQPWQLAILISPIIAITVFLVTAAAVQIHNWGLSWIWAIVTLLLLGWRWLLVRWTRRETGQIEQVLGELRQENWIRNRELSQAALPDVLPSSVPLPGQAPPHSQSNAQPPDRILQRILQEAQNDRPVWEDWSTFWSRCQGLIADIAQYYHPEVKYPLINIYIPQAYGLLRGTTDDMDRWMQKLTPVLGKLTIAQAYQGYETYRRLEPSARKFFQVWNWAQWLLNPAAAIARTATANSTSAATQELLFNLSQMLREAALRNLAQQAVALYSGLGLPPSFTETAAVAPQRTQTLREILDRAQPTTALAQQPLNLLLVGRTGAGKSSLINTLFAAELAEVDALPNTDRIQSYQWQHETGETLTLWDSPGYEQVGNVRLREQVLPFVDQADILLVVTPALDPALQMDQEFLQAVQARRSNLPTIVVVTQVDKLRPIREWQPPYDWVWGDRPKEIAIRDATQYRSEALGSYCDRVLPLVCLTAGSAGPWGTETLSLALLETLDLGKQIRLARCLRDQEAQVAAAAQIIDRASFQLATSQGLTTLLKSPLLQFLSTATTGSPVLGALLATRIPAEQLPAVLGKLQLAYDLFSLFKPGASLLEFDLLSLWPLILDRTATPERNAWALGHTLVEFWSEGLDKQALRSRFEAHLLND